MALTQQLRNTQSPASQWFYQHLNDRAMRHMVGTINDRLSALPILRVSGSNAQVVGTAVDYGVRWLFGPLDRRGSAMKGAQVCAHQYAWAAAPELVAGAFEQTHHATDVEELARWCVVLAWFERVYRDGHLPPQLERWARQPGSAPPLAALANTVPQADREDTALLLHSATGLWRNPQGTIVPNPTFSASGLVGGADADWIVGDTLWECKCTWQDRPCSRQHILQLLSYALLDTHDAYQLRYLGWYYVRQEQREVVDLATLCAELLGTGDVASLRQAFALSVGGILPPDPATLALREQCLPVLVEVLSSTGRWTLQEPGSERTVITAHPTGEALTMTVQMACGLTTIETPARTFPIAACWYIAVRMQMGIGRMDWAVLPTDAGACWIATSPAQHQGRDRLVSPVLPFDLTTPQDQQRLIAACDRWLHTEQQRRQAQTETQS